MKSIILKLFLITLPWFFFQSCTKEHPVGSVEIKLINRIGITLNKVKFLDWKIGKLKNNEAVSISANEIILDGNLIVNVCTFKINGKDCIAGGTECGTSLNNLTQGSLNIEITKGMCESEYECFGLRKTY